MKVWPLVIACVGFSLSVQAQTTGRAPSAEPDHSTPSSPSASAQSIFRTGVDLVALNVVATDGHQQFVRGLSADNFAIFENGARQEVSFFAMSRLPLDLALILDTSASMLDKIRQAQDAAIGFASTLRPGDRITVVDVKDRVRVLHQLDGDLDAARAAIASTHAGGGTALYNGVYLTLRDMLRQRHPSDDVRRQAIAVLSDGDDTASLVSFDDVMDVAKQAGIAVYTIVLQSPGAKAFEQAGRRPVSTAEYSMKALAQETGARAFFPADIRELASVYGSIADELASQYSLGYSPRNPKSDGTYRRVSVQVVDPPGVRARTRAGYQAPRSTQMSAR